MDRLPLILRPPEFPEKYMTEYIRLLERCVLCCDVVLWYDVVLCCDVLSPSVALMQI